MRKYFIYLFLLINILLPFNVDALDLYKSFEEKISTASNNYFEFFFPSYDDSGNIDGNLIVMDEYLIKYDLNNKQVYKIKYDDLSLNYDIDVSELESDSTEYNVKGDSDGLITVTNTSTNEVVFKKQYGGSGREGNSDYGYYSFNNKGVHDGYILEIESSSTDLGVEPGIILLKYDLKGNLVWQKNINDYYHYICSPIYHIKDEKFFQYFVDSDNKLEKYDVNLDNSLFNVETGLDGAFDLNFSYSKSGEIDGVVIAGYVDDSGNLYGEIVKFDLNGKEIFRYKYDKMSYFHGVISSKNMSGSYDGYIVSGVCDEGTVILKIGMDGKLVYKDVYVSNKFYRYSYGFFNNYENTGKQNGYILLLWYMTTSNPFTENLEKKELSYDMKTSSVKKLAYLEKIDDDTDSSSLYNIMLVKYTYPIYDISNDNTDEGTIIVNSSAYSGEVVKVNVTPKDGYALKRIVVLDEDGNEIEVSSDGSFVMPEGKVTVSALYSKIVNPDTVSACYVVLGVILLISIGTLIVNKKKEA